jgi:outer membrane protein assembly factor BamA
LKLSSLYFALLLVFMPLACLRSQSVSLKVITADKKSPAAKLNYRKSFPGKKEAYREIENIVLTLQYKGYLLAAADTIYADTNSLKAFITEGQLFKTAHLKLGNLHPGLASRLGISEKLYFNKPFKYKEVAKSFEKIIAYYENNGYPFAAVSLDSVEADHKQLKGVFHVERNRFFKIDSIRMEGNAKVSKHFLYRYLDVKEGMPYNEEALKRISQKIRQLPFVFEKQTQVVRLTDKTNKLYLFLEKKNASQFDGIIGLLPDATTKKTVITGDVKLKLVNGIFRNGETFDLEWRRLQSQTQDFKGRVIYPYLFGTPVGIDYSLKIYRKDTTFIDIHNDIGLQYYFSGLNNIKIYYKQRTSNLISTSGLETLTVLPDYADISTSSYGAGIFVEKVNYRFNPRKGIAFSINAQTGNRSIRRNPKINATAYDDLLLRSVQYQTEGSIAAYIPLYRNNVLKLGIQGASIFGNSTIFRNELFRIGGLKTLRGFDEESIYASTYVIPTIEYRFLFAQNSNILLFAEGAWYENNSNGSYLNDVPMSVGAGINFETKAGILSLNYGVGNQFHNGFDIRSGKIHFGLTALF